jgi:hypothetical protein
VRNPANPQSRPLRITAAKEGWFYHRAVHVNVFECIFALSLLHRANLCSALVLHCTGEVV